MSKEKVLVSYKSNYADEFDVSGFCIMNKEDWEDHKAKAVALFEKRAAKQGPKPDPQSPNYWREMRNIQEACQVEVYFGTNESIIYETLDCYTRSFTVKDISADELKTLQKFFGKEPHAGMVVMIDDYVFEEEDEE